MFITGLSCTSLFFSLWDFVIFFWSVDFAIFLSCPGTMESDQGSEEGDPRGPEPRRSALYRPTKAWIEG